MWVFTPNKGDAGGKNIKPIPDFEHTLQLLIPIFPSKKSI